MLVNDLQRAAEDLFETGEMFRGKEPKVGIHGGEFETRKALIEVVVKVVERGDGVAAEQVQRSRSKIGIGGSIHGVLPPLGGELGSADGAADEFEVPSTVAELNRVVDFAEDFISIGRERFEEFLGLGDITGSGDEMHVARNEADPVVGDKRGSYGARSSSRRRVMSSCGVLRGKESRTKWSQRC